MEFLKNADERNFRNNFENPENGRNGIIFGDLLITGSPGGKTPSPRHACQRIDRFLDIAAPGLGRARGVHAEAIDPECLAAKAARIREEARRLGVARAM